MSPTDIEKIVKSHFESDTKRLDRIEAKIDKLSDTIISLARLEEKVISMEKDRDATSNKFKEVDERLNGVETKTDQNEVTVKVVNRLFWIIISALLTGGIAIFLKG